ncbi:MAG: CRISPR-associated endonuclease Cas1 [Anaerolineae bacterium]|nr:CRISPR-associated endonuclease Cas1 [Anaerolineae bacterium]MDW8070879.1 CRISPR-associated endonuclease Cas1 [Anaerolineae bacterium]
MPPLYVVEQGAKIQKESRRLVVTKDEQVLQSVPLIKVEQVLIFGNVAITTPALVYLMHQGIDVIFCDQHGHYRGRVVGEMSGHSELRRWQYRRVDDPNFAVSTARAIVHAKLHNTRTLLLRYQREHPHPELQRAIERLGELLQQSERARSLNSLRGVEGAGAAAYFGVFRHLLRDPVWEFSGRMRRPPGDPVNVLLSFGYTLLVRYLESAVAAVGLDPYLGCLHGDAHKRPSLALDIAEEFRCVVVDSVVLRCVNSGLIRPENFSRQDDPARPVLLDEAGRNVFIREFEARLATTFTHPLANERVTYRRCFELQAREMARAMQSGTSYRPFMVR